MPGPCNPISPKRIVVIGATGFVGSAIVAHAKALGHEVSTLSGFRTPMTAARVDWSTIEHWIHEHHEQFQSFCKRIVRADVVVNAAGLASPYSRDTRELLGANTVFPAVVGAGCRAAGIRRMVHVSTAAVQGRMDPLDETPNTQPFSPYSHAKAEAERLLLKAGVLIPDELVLYRPTSVHGVGRNVTMHYARLAHRRVVPIAGRGEAPLPVALIENVAAGIVHVAVHRDVRPIVLQPWEGLTALALYRIFSRRRSYLQIPTWAAKAAVGLGTSIPWPELDGLARRTELLLVGQRQEANVLTELKFRIPVGREGWERLARDLQIRGRARRFTAS